MSAKPDSSQGHERPQDTCPPFAGMGAGLGFFQDWMKAAGAAMPGMVQAATQHPATSAWTMPTLDPEELDKRIQELKTVQFWLEQNTRMIAMTIQGLEVQKMTLATLQGMNVSMDKLRESLQAGHDTSPESSAKATSNTAAKAETETDPESQANSASAVNPMAWWNSLTQQFSQLASQAAQSVQEATQNVSAAVQSAAPSATSPVSASATQASAKTATKRTPARKTATTTRATPRSKSAASSTRKTSPKS